MAVDAPIALAGKRVSQISGVMTLNKAVVLSKRIVKALLRRGMEFVNTRPRLKKYIMAATRKLGFYGAARTLHAKLNIAVYRSHAARNRPIPTDLIHLTARAREVYSRLNSAIEHRQKETG